MTKLQEEIEVFRIKETNWNRSTVDANVQTEVILPSTASVGTMVRELSVLSFFFSASSLIVEKRRSI